MASTPRPPGTPLVHSTRLVLVAVTVTVVVVPTQVGGEPLKTSPRCRCRSLNAFKQKAQLTGVLCGRSDVARSAGDQACITRDLVEAILGILIILNLNKG